MKKEYQELEENIKRYFQVAVEDFRSEIKVYGEGISDIRRNLDDLSEKVYSIDEKVDLLEIKVGSVETKVDSLENKVDLLAEDMDYVKSEIVEIKDHFQETNKALEKKADKDALENQEKRLLALELNKKAV